ncbi:MAG: hypothetical protein HKN65_12540 [Woeseiaceae bacterium]|nr:hypothetical protein [Gammaproteobacteria bacterium]NNF50677.1 hypothetical protein [Woeseiaceae bacterium]NNK25534.1 hypothetical protein [Woeseiaceae bacterium]
MNQKEKGMFDRFLLALGSAALMPPFTAMPKVHRDRIVIARDVRLDSAESGPEIREARPRVRWAT